MDKVVYNVPFAKVDTEKRVVSGFATLNNVDKQKDIVTTEASLKAFKSFRGNIRELHDKIAAGRLLSFATEKYYDAMADKMYDGIFVRAYISKGAPNTWEKVLDGTLSGFSIGGEILDSENIVDENGDMVRVIKEYELAELSLVDNPANQLANVVSIEKATAFFDGIANTIEEKELKDMATDVEKSIGVMDAPAVEAVEEVAEVEVTEEPAVEAVAEVVVEEPVAESVETPEVVNEPVASDADVLASAINDIKALLEAKDTETNQAFGLIVEQLKELRDGVGTVSTDISGVKTELESVKSTVSEFDKRVESVEADTAVRKSGDLGEVAQVATTTQKSIWGGRFLSADL
jgi:regulator of RNase E activity RraB